MTSTKHDATRKLPKHRFFHKRAQKTKKHGAGWFFGDSNKNSNVKPAMNYPLCSLQFDGLNIPCSVCNSSNYYIINVSVDRSKTSTIATDIFLGTEANQFISHPYKSYVCHTCLNARFVYQPTYWNGLQQRIIEAPVIENAPTQSGEVPIAPAQAPLPPAPAQAPASSVPPNVA